MLFCSLWEGKAAISISATFGSLSSTAHWNAVSVLWPSFDKSAVHLLCLRYSVLIGSLQVSWIRWVAGKD